MSIWKDKARGKFRYSFYYKNQRYTGYCVHPDTREEATTKRESTRFVEIIKGRVKSRPQQDRAPLSGTYSLAECFRDYIKERGLSTPSWEENGPREVSVLLGFFRADTAVEDLTTERIEAFIADSRQTPRMIYLGGPKSGGKKRPLTNEDGETVFRSDSTTNRYLNRFRAVLKHALRTRPDKVKHVPNVRRLKEPEDSPNPIPSEIVTAIIKAAPRHLVDLVLLCVLTGMREKEALHAGWSEVRWQQRLILLQSKRTKANRGRPVLLNEVAYQLLRRLWDEVPKKNNYPIHDRIILYRHKDSAKAKPRPINSAKSAWLSTLDEVGVRGLYRFHDLKAAFVSWLADLGTSSKAIQELAAHRDIKTTMRYMKASDGSLRNAVESLGKAFGDTIQAPTRTQDSHTVSNQNIELPAKLLKTLATPAGLEPATSSLEVSSFKHNSLKKKETS